MNERVPRSAWPLGLIGMMVLVVGVERTIARRDTDLSTMFAMEWRANGNAAYKQAPKVDILCLGTSVTRMGVAPTILEEKLGRSAYNLALSGGQPFASYTMLRHALAAGAKPKAIVVDFKWSAIAMDHTWNERVLPEMATLRDCAELAWAARDGSYFARLALVSKLPSYRCRTEIRANVLAAIGGKEPERNGGRWVMQRNAKMNKGGILVPVSGVPKQEFDPNDTHLFPPKWTCHPISEQYINKFFLLAAAEKIPVLWLITPVGPGVLARRDATGAEDRYDAFVRKATARYPGVTVVDSRRSKYAVEAFTDTTHLNLDGAVTLTNDLSDVIARRLAAPADQGPRWVDLPPYRPSPGAKALEDLAESTVVVNEKFRKPERR